MVSYHEITDICNIQFLSPASQPDKEMLTSTMFLVWYGSKFFSKWGGEIKFLLL